MYYDYFCISFYFTVKSLKGRLTLSQVTTSLTTWSLQYNGRKNINKGYEWIYMHMERERESETKQKYKSMQVKITSSNECSVRRARVMELLWLRVTCKGFSLWREVKWMSEEKRSSYRMSKYKGFQETFAHFRDIEKNMETPKDLFHLKYLSLWEIKWAGKSFFNSNYPAMF